METPTMHHIRITQGDPEIEDFNSYLAGMQKRCVISNIIGITCVFLTVIVFALVVYIFFYTPIPELPTLVFKVESPKKTVEREDFQATVQETITQSFKSEKWNYISRYSLRLSIVIMAILLSQLFNSIAKFHFRYAKHLQTVIDSTYFAKGDWNKIREVFQVINQEDNDFNFKTKSAKYPK